MRLARVPTVAVVEEVMVVAGEDKVVVEEVTVVAEEDSGVADKEL